MAIDRDGDLAATEVTQIIASVAERDGLVDVASTIEGMVIPLVEERITLSKRKVAAGTVRVATYTDVYEATADIDLDNYRVEIERVPVGRVVDAVPPARAEGDTTIISVVEERMVLVKQLVLTEELHIRHVIASETVSEAVTLRRQHATVERFPSDRPARPETD